MADEKDPVSARVWFRNLIREIIDDQEVFKQSDIAAKALEIAKNDDLWYELQEEWQNSAAYDEVAQVVTAMRQAARRNKFRVAGDRVFTDQGIANEFGRKFPTFWEWWEHVGDHHIKLPRMNKEELFAAANERLARSKQQFVTSRFMRRIGEGLNDNELVEDRFTEKEAQEIYAQVEQEVEDGNLFARS